jgi:putative ABC transport system permease protein
MILIHLNHALRKIYKQPGFSLINISGLMIGMAATLLILQYVRFEMSYDRFHEDWDRIYRVSTVNLKDGEMIYKDAMSFNLTGPTLQETLPEVVDFARTFKIFEGISIKRENRIFRETNALIASPGFLQIFNYPLKAGDPLKALSHPFSVLLTESMAGKLFPDSDPVGQSFEIPVGQFAGLYQVTGIMEDVPSNTHMGFSMLISYETLWRSGFEPNWNNFIDYTFIKVAEGTDPKALQEKMIPMSREYIGENTTLVFWIQPVADIHLHSDFSYEAEINGSASRVNFLLITALFIAIIAWVNYINISTARSMDRAREVGIRKIIGAGRFSLIGQFLIESMMINFLAMAGALFIIYLMSPLFRVLIGMDFPVFWTDINFWLIVIIFFLSGIVASGIYPAMIQSSFRPLAVIKGKFNRSGKGIHIRKLLVILQFTISIFFIAATLIVYNQIEHMRNMETGMNLDQVLVIREGNMIMEGDSLSDERFLRFSNRMNSIPGIADLSTSSSIPAGGTSNIGSMSGGIWWEQHITENQYTYYFASIDESFLPVYEIDLLAGENFHHMMPEDTIMHTLINESALKQLGFPDPQSAIGEHLVLGDNHVRRFRIVGVINDFNRQSLKYPVEPTLYTYNHYQNGTFYSVKLNTVEIGRTVEEIGTAWAGLFPDIPFEYYFADERFNNQYKADLQFGNVFSIFTLITILIACLGLFGLSYYMMQGRIKEIGVRKVLGSTSGAVMLLISKDFILMVLVSFILGIPIILIIMDQWLQNYANRIQISPWILLLSGVSVFFIVLLTVGYQTYKTSRLNPAETLRYE